VGRARTAHACGRMQTMVTLPPAAFASAGCASGVCSSFDASTCGYTGSLGASHIHGGGAGTSAEGERRRSLFFSSEALVTDRLGEFQRLARERNALPTPGMAAAASSKDLAADAAKNGNKGFMREFFECVNRIQGVLNRGRANIKAMGEVLDEALQATTQDRQREISNRLQDLVQDTNAVISAVKNDLEQLKARSDKEDAKKPQSAEGRIRSNMQQAMAKKHHQLLLDFQKAQVDYKNALEQRQRKELEILMPNTTEDERQRMIEDGESTSLLVAKKMAGAHAMLLDEVQRIRDKHQDILRLEASIADLAQMFQEMAVLVEAQGEMLDAIELNVSKTKGYTAKAEKQLVTARKEQHKGQRMMCCLTVTLLIVVIIILGPILLKNGG